MAVVARTRAQRIDPNDRSGGSVVFSPPPPAALDAALAHLDDEDDGPEAFGPYTVHEELGEGGMATVHRAEREGWQRNGQHAPIALKRLFRHLSEDAQFVAAFVQEAHLARLLDHPNIARSYEHGKIDGQYFMAMEYVPGPTLRALMIQSRTAAGSIPLRIVVEILVQLTEALAHAHDLRDEQGRRLGLVHRDVTPANVIISTSGVVKLIDFGIAKAKFSRVQTQAGCIKGKISYVAPEYTLGQLDHRADLFAVGVIAHELLTGRRLFDGDSQFSVVGKLRDLRVPPPSRHDPQVPPELDDIVMGALERDPDQRWQNALHMNQALVALAEQLGPPVTGRELCEWIAWAFAQPARQDSFVGRVIDSFAPGEARSVAERRGGLIDKLDVSSMAMAAEKTEMMTSSMLVDDLDVTAPRARVEVDDSRTRVDPLPGLLPPLVDDSRTRVDNLLDGWSPPTSTEIVRPHNWRLAREAKRPVVSDTLLYMFVMLAVVSVAAAVAMLMWAGYL